MGKFNFSEDAENIAKQFNVPGSIPFDLNSFSDHLFFEELRRQGKTGRVDGTLIDKLESMINNLDDKYFDPSFIPDVSGYQQTIQYNGVYRYVDYQRWTTAAEETSQFQYDLQREKLVHAGWYMANLERQNPGVDILGRLLGSEFLISFAIKWKMFWRKR